MCRDAVCQRMCRAVPCRALTCIAEWMRVACVACVVLYCIVLFCIVLYCIVLSHVTSHPIMAPCESSCMLAVAHPRFTLSCGLCHVAIGQVGVKQNVSRGDT